MNEMTFLFTAFALVWTGTLGYLIRLAFLRRQLEEKIERLEERSAARENDNA